MVTKATCSVLDLNPIQSLNMNGNRIEGLGSPVIATDAASKDYVDLNALPVIGGAMSGDLDMGGNSIINMADPVNPQDAATKIYVDSVFPAGVVVPFAAFSIPTGWLECNGQAVSRTTFANLFAALDVAYGNGDGSTTFNVPDYRGEFLRGTDNSRGADPDSASRTDRGDGVTGDAIGTKQSDAFESHTHTKAGFNGAFIGFAYPGFDGNGDGITQTPTNPTGGSETRPRNVNVLYIIFAG